MIRLEIWLDRELVGSLTHDGATNQFQFEYTPGWKAGPRSFPISPQLPLERAPDVTAERHSAQVRQFFENLLPEGEALDHAAQASGTSKANLVGLIVALGRETAGAVRIVSREGVSADRANPDYEGDGLRLVTAEQLSERIRKRAEIPFSVWDGRVRLSIAGFQDKIAIYEKHGNWYLVDGPRLASTVIVKPAPTNPQMASLPANEFMCMHLAQVAGIEAAPTRLVAVPEPVLFVSRFDRVETDTGVRRLHVIDGCQALGLSVSMKYERAYGDGRDVQHIRDGTSYPKLFRLLDLSPQPARERLALLRWVIFQVLIGNTDAHGKNISFFSSVQGIRLAPAYDLVCIPALGSNQLSDTYAMAIGDAFRERDLSPFEWANFARQCGLPLRMVSQRLGQLSLRVLDSMEDVVAEVIEGGVHPEVAKSIAERVSLTCTRQFDLSPDILKIRETDFDPGRLQQSQTTGTGK